MIRDVVIFLCAARAHMHGNIVTFEQLHGDQFLPFFSSVWLKQNTSMFHLDHFLSMLIDLMFEFMCAW